MIPALVSSLTPLGFFLQAAEILRISLTASSLHHFQTYYRELRSGNQKANLTRITKEKEVYLDHFIESLLPEKIIPAVSSLIDLGSGGGFPGIPLKIVRPDIAVTLVDSSLKKTLFQRHIIRTLELDRIEALHTRVEALSSAGRRYEVCISRAFAPLSRFISVSRALKAPEGIIIAMQGPNFAKELAIVERRLSEWELSIKRIERFVLPFTRKRRVIIVLG